MDVNFETAFTQTIAHGLSGFLNDYTTDRRGDIGSLIRIEAIEVARILQPKLSPSLTYCLRTCRVPLSACMREARQGQTTSVALSTGLFLGNGEFYSFPQVSGLCFNFYSSRANLSRRFEHVSDVSSQEYFFQLLSSWSQEWLRLPLLQGLATSAVAGAEGLVRASRAALIQFFNSQDPHSDPNILVEVLQVLSTALNDNLPEDRYAIPIIELIAFLLDSYHSYTVAVPNESNPIFRKVFLLVQKAHFRSANIARMEGAVQVYAALSGIGNLRGDVFEEVNDDAVASIPKSMVHNISQIS